MADFFKNLFSDPGRELKFLFLRKAVLLPEKDYHKIILRRGFIAGIIYSILYGIYEYYVVYTGPRLVDTLGAVLNWVIMYAGLILVVGFFTMFSIQYIIMGLFTMTVVEDLVFWMCQWVKTGMYPFPAGNWWDSTLASYRVLGGWGQAIPVWPFVPFYYLPGFFILFEFYLLSSLYNGEKYGRIVAWISGPFFIAIIGGALGTDYMALIMLLAFPTICYIYIISVWLYNRLQKKSNVD